MRPAEAAPAAGVADAAVAVRRKARETRWRRQRVGQKTGPTLCAAGQRAQRPPPRAPRLAPWARARRPCAPRGSTTPAAAVRKGRATGGSVGEGSGRGEMVGGHRRGGAAQNDDGMEGAAAAKGSDAGGSYSTVKRGNQTSFRDWHDKEFKIEWRMDKVDRVSAMSRLNNE